MLEMGRLLEEMQRGAVPSIMYATVKTDGEIAPTDIVPVIVGTAEEYAVRPMRWGFPHWRGGQAIINARAETAFNKPMFNRALLEHRVVVPTGGFYEWTHEEGRAKRRYLFRRPGQPLLYLAGMYDWFEEPDGSRVERFVILTTEANASMAPFHDRMPVLLDGSERAQWLRGKKEDLQRILNRVPFELEAMPAQRSPKRSSP